MPKAAECTIDECKLCGKLTDTLLYEDRRKDGQIKVTISMDLCLCRPCFMKALRRIVDDYDAMKLESLGDKPSGDNEALSLAVT